MGLALFASAQDPASCCAARSLGYPAGLRSWGEAALSLLRACSGEVVWSKTLAERLDRQQSMTGVKGGQPQSHRLRQRDRSLKIKVREEGGGEEGESKEEEEEEFT